MPGMRRSQETTTRADDHLEIKTCLRSRSAPHLVPTCLSKRRRRHLPLPSGYSLMARWNIPRWGHLHEAPSGVRSRSPITTRQLGCRPGAGKHPCFPAVFSSPAAPGWNKSHFGLDPGFAPQSPVTHADAEAAHRELGRVLHRRDQPNLQRRLPLDLMHPRVVTSRRDPRLRACAHDRAWCDMGSEEAAAAGAWPAPASP